ncbi:cell cycle control protein [Gymnopus androsaceus JB14]|uniref:Cell cycle control protein n=1 Tax=Gymnopus androsaceus JB14 TaxID=1447944 RepID=A0A6A4GXJ9_9AGAR|nr:cell cycle control protein [Gymnopus androsaceus JB14]
MGLFRRKGSDTNEDKKEKGAWKRPANTAFKQQRLKAWQPILTPKTVLPTFFIIAIIFGPIGGLLIWGSSLVSEMTFDYTNCENLTPATSNTTIGTWTTLSSSQYSYHLSSKASKDATTILAPAYALVNNSGSSDVSNQMQCIIQFDVPADLAPSVFIYYKLTNFFQNHRRYVKSLDSDQLSGKGGSISTLNSNGGCKPLVSIGNQSIYPCGLIANSVFNDTFASPVLLNPANSFSTTNVTYDFSSTGIAWPGEAKKYVSNPIGHGYNSLDEIVPPPNWAKQFPNGYTSDNQPPDLATNEHFQNWMRTAGLPTFSKLWGRNDDDTMKQGRYSITIGLNFPVQPYKGTKSIVISTVSWIGGKNPFLGWAYVAVAALFMFLAVAGTVRHMIKPRRLGDMSLLSWNRQ